ncbi:MAG: hypothetical protein NZ602_00515 [Thermoguttaceae bacterium]|nr:hypothetical protein [Thermoguttaceae bacterium]
MPGNRNTKESWGSRLGVILAVTGSAVGLGNFLRFPGLAAKYEGGAFMIPYFVSLLILGLPLAWGEWAMGRYGGRHGYNSSPGIFRAITRHNIGAYLGILGLLVPVGIYMYYVIIESWCLGYAWYYLSGQMAKIGAEARQLASQPAAVAPPTAQADSHVGVPGQPVNSASLADSNQLGRSVVSEGQAVESAAVGVGTAAKIAQSPPKAFQPLASQPPLGNMPGQSPSSKTSPPADADSPTSTRSLLSKEPYEKLFNSFVGETEHGAAFGGPAVVFLAICFLLNFYLIYRGLSKGIERFCIWAMPALIICAFLVLLRVLTLPNILEALGFMWNPHTEKASFLEALANPRMWLDAASQIFFSLSVGFGVIITYASYLKEDDDIALSSLTSVAGNEFCEVALGGMITVPAAYLFLGAAAVLGAVGSSFDLGFKTLPMVFEAMPLGYIVGFLFFVLLFLAAVTSSLSMLQPAIALLEEGLGLNRRASVSILGFITLCGSFYTFYFSQNRMALVTLDNWLGTFCIYLLAMYQTILFGWVLGPQRGMEELRRGAEIRVPGIIGWSLKYVAPVYLFAIFLGFLYQQLVLESGGMFREPFEKPLVGATVVFILVLTGFFYLIIQQSVRRWERLERSQKEVAL